MPRKLNKLTVILLGLAFVSGQVANMPLIALASPGYLMGPVNAQVTGALKLSVSGSASSSPYVGTDVQQFVTIDWGEIVGGNPARDTFNVKTAANFTTHFTGAGNNKAFDTSWTPGSHTYSSAGTKTILVKVHHGGFPGKEGDSSEFTTDVFIPQAALNVIKHVVGGSSLASAFTMHVSGTNVSPTSFSGSESGTVVSLDPGSYSVTEDAVSNYSGSLGDNCSGSIASGETKTCTITNTYNPTPILGCTDPAANNYNPDADEDDGSCTYTVPGCTDPAADNYDPSANQDDGSCTYTVLGCTDPAANNYNSFANQDDGSCTYDPTPILGCMDPVANNYSSAATQDDGSCTYDVLGCTDPAANNYDPTANQNNGSCTYDVLGCTDPAANNYDPTANEDDDSCTYDPAPVLGCMDESANNFNSDATQDTDPTSCTYDPAPVLGCTNPEATNYNPAATQDDGSCITQAPADVTPPVSTFDEGRGHEIIDTELLSLSLTGQSSDDVGPVGDAKSGVASAEMTIYSIPDILVDGQLNGAAWEALSCAQIPENAVPIEIVALNLVSVNPLQVSWSHDLANPANGIYCAVVHATDNAGNVENTGVAGPFAYTFVAPTPTPTPPPSGGGGGSGSGGGGGGTGFYLSPTISGGGGGGGGQVLGAATTGEVLGESVCSVEYLHDYLRQGKKNDSGQVNLLQEFLNKELGLNLPITGFFGQLTRTAVEQFQVKHKEQVLRPWLSYGLPSENTPTGYVYKTTKRWINMLECPDLNLQMPTLP